MMTVISLEHLLQLAYDLCISISYRDLNGQHPQLLGYTRGRYITLDVSLRDKPRQHKCVLAEEIGHALYPPGANHISYHIAGGWAELNFLSRGNIEYSVGQDERHALKWATGLLIPDQAFWEYADDGRCFVWEWCEYFDVEQWFFEMKVGFIRAGQDPRRRMKWREIVRRD
jgi:hypothetical protein